MTAELQAIQTQIYDFLERANKALPLDDKKTPALFYNGSFISGCLDKPDSLFVGINPGFRLKDVCKEDQGKREREELRQSECKFIDEYGWEEPAKLAVAVVDCLLGGKKENLRDCAETSFKSFLCSPREGSLNKQLSKLPDNLRNEHREIMLNAIHTIIEQVKPKQIVCIGMSVFNEFVREFKIDAHTITITDPVDSLSGKSKRTFHKQVDFKDITVHGVLHLSGARPSGEIKAKLQEIFSRRDYPLLKR